MRPSGGTPVASTIVNPAPEQANCPRCMTCQSVMEPSTAEYSHIGDTTTRLGSVMPPSWMGSKSFELKESPRYGAATEMWCSENALRNSFAKATAPGWSPCRHIVSAATEMGVPDRLV